MNIEEMKKRAEDGAALAEKARSGPWMVELDRNDQPNLHGTNRDVWIALFPHQCVRSIEIEANADAAFVADARMRVPALAADVLTLIAEVERLANLVAASGRLLAEALRERDAAKADVAQTRLENADLEQAANR